MNILAHPCAVCDQPLPCGCCRLWEGSRTWNGYGVLPHSGQSEKVRYAHRWAYEQAHGPIPDGMVVMHLCDVPACYLVEHLRLGTHAENHADAVAKGRKLRGAPLGMSGPCGNGHSDMWFTDTRGARACRGCRRDADARYKARRAVR